MFSITYQHEAAILRKINVAGPRKIKSQCVDCLLPISALLSLRYIVRIGWPCNYSETSEEWWRRWYCNRCKQLVGRLCLQFVFVCVTCYFPALLLLTLLLTCCFSSYCSYFCCWCCFCCCRRLRRRRRVYFSVVNKRHMAEIMFGMWQTDRTDSMWGCLVYQNLHHLKIKFAG